jgi:hypothetical protein
MDRSYDAIFLLGLPQQNYAQDLEDDHNPKSIDEALVFASLT